MLGVIANIGFFISSLGFILVGGRARVRTTFTVPQLAGLGGVLAVLAVSRGAVAVHEIVTIGNSQWRVLMLLTAVQFVIGAVFFFDAARRKKAGSLRS